MLVFICSISSLKIQNISCIVKNGTSSDLSEAEKRMFWLGRALVVSAEYFTAAIKPYVYLNVLNGFNK